MNFKLIPKINYTNFRKEYGICGAMAFKRWFYFERFWSGKIINIGIKHFHVSFDFRKNWLMDMLGK
jgi:hypothetical protein